MVRLLVVMLASLGYLLSKTDVSLPIGMSVGFFLLELFCACWFCHAEVYALRPGSGELGAGDGRLRGGCEIGCPGGSFGGFGRAGARAAAGFYLLVAAGGAAGTMFVAVVSPMVFRANYDLPLAFAATAAMADGGDVAGWMGAAAAVGREHGAVFCAGGDACTTRLPPADALVNVRNFYGSLRVKQTRPAAAGRDLAGAAPWVNQTRDAVVCGRVPARSRRRTMRGIRGWGWRWRYCCRERRPRRIGVIGLGAGTMAAYGRDGDHHAVLRDQPAGRRDCARAVYVSAGIAGSG